MTKQYCYYCGKELDERDQVITEVPLDTVIKGEDGHKHKGTVIVDRTFHHNCLVDFVKVKQKEEKDKQENSDWDAVYQFFLHKTLQVPVGSQEYLSKYALNRLLGLRVGKFMQKGTNTRCLKRGYSFRTILVCLKYSKRATDKALQTVKFQNERHKINYIMSIIISNIDFVQEKLQRMDRQNRRIDKLKKEDANRKSKTSKELHYVHKGKGMNRFDWVD
ncbi:hypothetical protein DKZ29_08015 [Limosilactobacillus reuteri]|uniref:Uncharacterized protein n=1 Tax=Limosilactobacillus reuteri TaxID=1598 RepID=A0ABD6Y601_LIMRT|nr:hypothetical protein [Limosilactobacillus reuteri]PWT35101.1 hypothetical protein DKZ24_05180 [Limosilactobacillus reuteri]PWT37206.1 hypothetical protein DKZ35_06475 [Limosilactobacillus reuteri]PWT57600.1 hypothetical protein DKZ29_08015 [Limosilactobacillus reuteri]PWT59954.1 hypothetical protein DKZ30_04745 [Limosilactobacillus reuteri]PWT66542.1 hypothetical protein DKZ28_04865 [Limosilactobacillus reuteri]